MIDIHNHILPNVDDGPKNKDEALQLLIQAAEQGIKGIVASPHHLHTNYSNNFKDIELMVSKFNNIPEVKDLNIEIYPGQELRISDQILKDLDDEKICGINHSNYLLLELPSNGVPHYTQRLLYEIQTKGYIPIIVHPERNKAISKDINQLFKLVNIGALSQITASSLTGDLGRNIQNLSIKMIEHNLVHFIASDAHDVKKRPFSLGHITNNPNLKNIEKNIQLFLSNNEAMVQNKKIAFSRPIEYQKKKFLGLF